MAPKDFLAALLEVASVSQARNELGREVGIDIIE
jgi:hypothetical protein